jgi:hypothetical protein
VDSPDNGNKDGPITTEFKKIVPSDLAVGDGFGLYAALYQDTLVVGAPLGDNHGPDSGAAYIFYRNQGGTDNWGMVKKLVPSDGISQASFGIPAIYGDTIAISAPYDDDQGQWSGSVYIYYRNLGGTDNWDLVKKLSASDGASMYIFGSSVSISGDYLVAGAPLHDAAYIFNRNNGGSDDWGEVIKLQADSENEEFGISVSIEGDDVAVGAYSDPANGALAGSIYIYNRNQGGPNAWGFVKKIYGNKDIEKQSVGYSLCLSSGNLIVGNYPGDKPGTAYIFGKDYGGPNNWGTIKSYSDNHHYLVEQYGLSVSISGQYAVVGDPAELRDGTSTEIVGAVNVYWKDQGGTDYWGSYKILRAGNAKIGDYFGRAAAVYGTTVFVGAVGVDDKGTDSGAGYIYYLE